VVNSNQIKTKEEKEGMKALGIVRKVDNLGRIVLPKEIRDTLRIDIKDPLEILATEDSIILRKYVPGCTLCGEISDNYIMVKGRRICLNCSGAIYKKMKP